MIEVVVKESLEKPYVVRVPGQLPQIHIGADMQIDQIRKELANEISTSEFQKFEKLWTDDSHPREFMQEGDYLKIMDKS
jgi:hypothetical protein